MRLQFTLTGVSPILMHNGAAGIDTRSALSREIAAIAAKKGGDRTEPDDLRLQELECQRSLYLDADGKPTLPEAALRAMIEASARKVKQGPQVREGLLIEWVSFCYDVERYGETLEKLVQTTQFTVPAVVQRQAYSADPGSVRLPVVGGRRGRRRRGAGGQGEVDGVAGGGRAPHRPGRLAAGEEGGVFGRFDVEEVLELADDGAAAEPPRRSRRPASAGQAWQGAACAGRPDKGRIATSDARVARRPVAGNRVVAWRGGALTWLGAAWRGEAGTVFSTARAVGAVRSPAESGWPAGVGSCADYVHPNLIRSEDRMPVTVTQQVPAFPDG